MAENVEVYRTHSRWSDPGRWAPLLAEIRPEPAEIVRAVSGVLMHPFIAPMRGVEMPAAAADDRDTRSVETILERVREHAWLQVTPSILSFATGAPVEVTIGS